MGDSVNVWELSSFICLLLTTRPYVCRQGVMLVPGDKRRNVATCFAWTTLGDVGWDGGAQEAGLT